MPAAREHYTAVAIVLHWAIAAAIVFLLPLGFWMHDAAKSGAGDPGALFSAFQLHKSVGLTVLALSLVRLGWRIANPPPPLPAHMPAWERLAAKATHWAFYALMIALPLSGWVFVSAGWSLHENAPLAVPTRWFDLFGVPHLFDLASAGADVRESVAQAAFTAHAALAYAAIALAALHVAAALKHHVIDRDGVLAQMVPVLRAPGAAPAPKQPLRLAILGGGLALVLVALGAASLAALSYVNAPPPAPAIEAQAPPEPEAAPLAEPEAPGAPPAWAVTAGESSIQFAYLYADDSGETRFAGRFTRWRADIRFDPENLEASSADVRIDTASAQTGVAMHDSALAGAGWFNPAAFPTARFQSQDIRRTETGYEARGALTMGGQTHNVRLPFMLNISGERAVMDGQITINRRSFGLGAGAEGDDLIARDVIVTVHVETARAP